jgi:predicted nucleic acid-binding protein
VGADYLVTNDKHFNILKRTSFPIVKVVNEDEFKNICLNFGFG